jgi:molybdenum cofactor cytidylyltransferase
MEMKMKIDGVVLAAGFSRRAGVFKMELPLGEKKLIERTIDSMMEFCSRVIVVAGYKSEKIFRLKKMYAGVDVVLNPHYARGMFTSVQEGIKHVKSEWFFFTPGDYPLVSGAVYQRLLEAPRRFPAARIFIPVFKNRKGHPILVKSVLVKELLTEPGDSNLRNFIRRQGFVPVEVDDDAILLDIDTGEDYQRAKARWESG